MMKLLMAALCCLASVITSAQFKQIAQGPIFEEPEIGFTKILLLQNNTTIFFNITSKNGINVKMYDAGHKQKIDKFIKPAYGELKNGNVNAIFELKGDVVLLISKAEDKTPVLYRLIVDGQTGDLKEEKKIAELMKVTAGKEYAIVFGNVPMPNFYVRKDPYSNNYAIALFNSFESDRSKRIEVVLYGEDHKEIARAYYASPDEKYKYLKYIDMTVIGNQKVSIMVFAYNTGRDKESELLLANLNAGTTKVTIQQLKFTQDRTINWGITRYNPVSKKILMIAAAKSDKKDGYETFLCKIDPFTQKLEKVADASPKGLEETYIGMPQNLFINKDGSFTIVYEEMAIEWGSYGSRGQFKYTDTRLGTIAISLYNKEEKEVKSYLVKKTQYLSGLELAPFYLSDREGSATAMVFGTQFKSFAYLNGGAKNYILMNDIERNRESTRGKKITPINGLGKCDAYYFNISGNNGAPERNYLFGEPADKKSHNLALFAISDYNSEKNVYTTLKLEKDGKEKGVRVIWLQP